MLIFGDAEAIIGGDFTAVVVAAGGGDASDCEVEPDCGVVDTIDVPLEATACLVGVVVREGGVEVVAVVVSVFVDDWGTIDAGEADLEAAVTSGGVDAVADVEGLFLKSRLPLFATNL